ncbi:metallocarboxypeptidase A-like protein ARB_03789 isoform X2 [Cryptomeria japonica]|uniref:metallocarboxypeptidase A-like protein ARB_03789 isoform X2 n=1 Tax=Cryptomeria japonica TaxID=3369 RepID=UPI0027DAA994|nr:metallocarboxypeptidase A-like protein ARB_03789 isoform X2 [Cryptomeria japonica]
MDAHQQSKYRCFPFLMPKKLRFYFSSTVKKKKNISFCSMMRPHGDLNPGSQVRKSAFIFLAVFLSLGFLNALPARGNGLVVPVKQQLSYINYSLYHQSDILLQEVEALVARHRDKMSMKILRSISAGYSAEISVITFAHGQEKAEDDQKIRILLNFGQHGREMITSEVALRLLNVLAGEYHLLALDENAQNDILQKLIIKVVPMENLNGRKMVEAGKLCERKNGRGVDINRNWSVDWGKKEKDYDPAEEYPGTAPFSEPETKIMQKLVHSFKPHLWVNVHSGMEALFMPYDHRNTTPDGASAKLMKLILQKLNHLHCKDNCVVGSGGGSVGYLAHGTSTDYMYEIVRVPLAFTFEIYGDPKASNDDCFRMFNPLDSSIFESILDNWCTAFFRMFMILPGGLYNLSTEEFHTVKDDIISISMKQARNSSISNNFHTSRKTWTSGHSLLMTSDKRFEWDTEWIKTVSQLLFISSSLLLILLFCKRTRCIPCVQIVFRYFHKLRT